MARPAVGFHGRIGEVLPLRPGRHASIGQEQRIGVRVALDGAGGIGLAAHQVGDWWASRPPFASSVRAST